MLTFVFDPYSDLVDWKTCNPYCWEGGLFVDVANVEGDYATSPDAGRSERPSTQHSLVLECCYWQVCRKLLQ